MTSGHDAAHAAAKAGFGDAPYTNLTKNQDLITIVAIGMSESGGNANAENHNSNGTTDAGYWQINQIHWGGLQISAVKDLNVNAGLAYRVSGNGKNFQPWTDYKNNKYRTHIGAAQNAVKSLGTESVQTGLEDIAGAEQVGDVVDATAGALGKIGSVFEATWKILADAGAWVGNPHNWTRIVQVVGGGAILVVGAGMVLKETDVGKAATKAATKGAL
jgi:hypothetical protein